MFETGIAHAAGTHMMAALPDSRLGCEYYMSNYLLEEDLPADPFPVKGGMVHVPTGPGLGVTVDLGKVEKYRSEVLE